MATSTKTSSPPRRQTTLLIGGSNGTALLCAILGDVSNPRNAGHTVRVATRSPSRFVDPDTGEPRQWRCNEQKAFSDFVPSTLLPTSWTTHVGTPDAVLDYSADDDNASLPDDSYSGKEMSAMERAISGVGTSDDGGVADVIVLCCPVMAHLSILRLLARALYRLDRRGILRSSPSAPPILIGTMYAAGGFDWMARIAFTSEKPRDFSGVWKRGLALFGLKAFPYLCKSLEPGVVTLYGRYPQLLSALSPSTPLVRRHARRLLERVLQREDTGKSLSFVGISAAERLGGDGTVEEEEKADVGGEDIGATSDPTMLVTRSMADQADPNCAFGFLACTLNATNQILHPCILAALFHDPSNPSRSDATGTIPWDPDRQKTKLPRFYADGAARPETGRLITAIAGGEMYTVIDALDVLLAPRGMSPISSQHGGEPVGRFVMTEVGNHPRDLGRRSGLTELAVKKEFFRRAGPLPSSGVGNGFEGAEDAALDVIEPKPTGKWIKHAWILEKAMSYGLSHNTRLGYVLSPALSVPPEEGGGGEKLIRPNPKTRFFIDDIPHGLCVILGLGELLGFNLERDMPETLALVRKLQRWMGKEYVIPEGGGNEERKIVGGSRDLAETSAPQAFGVSTVEEFRNFLNMNPFAESKQRWVERSVIGSALVSRL